MLGCRLKVWYHLLAIGSVAVTVQAATPDPGELRVTVPERCELEVILPRLQSDSVRVVVADVSAIRLRSERTLTDVPLRSALNRLSTEFDRRWLLRGRTLALQRRFGEPDEDPGVELEELRAAAADLCALVRPFAPGPLDQRYILRQVAFERSLSVELQQRMINEGVPLAALPQQMRAAWLEINAAKAYSGVALEFERAARCFEVWSQVSVRDSAPQLGRTAQLQLEFPDPLIEQRVGGVMIVVPRGNLPPHSAQPEGVELPPRTTRIPEDLQAEWPIPVTKLSLRSLTEALVVAGGPKVRVPEYAEGRMVLVGSRGSRADVLTALADLWGWEWRKDKEGYRLGRARVSAARDPVELHRKVLEAMPPPVWHSAEAVKRRCLERWGRQMELILKNADQAAGANWTRFRAAGLSQTNQMRLANTVAMLQFSRWSLATGNLDRPPAWIVTPERGVLRLSGPIRPGEHPLLSFHVLDDTGKNWMWGWSVGTAVIGK